MGEKERFPEEIPVSVNLWFDPGYDTHTLGVSRKSNIRHVTAAMMSKKVTLEAHWATGPSGRMHRRRLALQPPAGF